MVREETGNVAGTFMTNVMPIPRTTSLITSYWTKAEISVRESIRQKHHDADEEFITKLFHGEFREVLEAGAKDKTVERAFLEDLRRHIPESHLASQLVQLARGISATVALHPRQIEKMTGGDIGLVLVRPNVGRQRIQVGTLNVDKCYRRGLLCQVKMNRRSGRGWGSFTTNQQNVLVERTDYLTLLLYEYKDKSRRDLMPFQWQVCAGRTLSDVERWLKSGSFPNLSNSTDIIQQLGSGKVGTENSDLIDQFIAPPNRESLVIKIGWPPGEGPPPIVFLGLQVRQSQLEALQE